MKTGMKLGICALVGIALGYVLGCYAPATALNEESVRGDISKVSKFNRAVVSPSMSAFQERILNDSVEMKKTAVSLAVLNNRMTEFGQLVGIAVEVSDGIEQLKESVAGLQSVSKLAENARLASEQALEAFDAMCEGDAKQAPNQYETASQNLVLAYLLVERQLNVAKGFVSEVDNYLKGKSIEDNVDLALVRDLWAGYCTCDAVLSNDSGSLAYWKDKESLVSEELLGIKFKDKSVSRLFPNSLVAAIFAEQRLFVQDYNIRSLGLSHLNESCVIGAMLDGSLDSICRAIYGNSFRHVHLLIGEMLELSGKRGPIVGSSVVPYSSFFMNEIISLILGSGPSLVETL